MDEPQLLPTLASSPVWLDRESWYVYEPAWIDADAAAALFEQLRSRPTWGERAIVAFGTPILQPRLVDWEGDVPYRYSGQTLEPRPWSPDIAAMRDALAALCHAPFNHLLLNLYRDGRDSVAMHGDNEPELGITPVIASVSLGATRRFVVEHRKVRKWRRSIDLVDGSLLVMGGAMQRRWRHAVPKQPSIAAPRVNLTFRVLLGPPGWRDPGWGERRRFEEAPEGAGSDAGESSDG